MHIGSFNAYATRFFSPSYGFALSWNYWFNDAISVASDLTAAQLVLEFWTPWHPWVFSVLAWVFLVSVNASHVRAYGELGEGSFPGLHPKMSHCTHRILAIVPQGRDYRDLHHSRNSGQCRCKSFTYLHRRTELEHTRRTLCRRFCRFCEGFRDR
jgi:hypothetical protein